MKIGLLGGSFDPPHKGHLYLANEAMKHEQLQKIVFIPSFQNPWKHKTVASPFHRLAMVKKLAELNPLYEVSDIEIRKESISYFDDTVKSLLEDYEAGTSFFLIVGSDIAKDISKWRNSAYILSNTITMEIPRNEYSSSNVRKNIQERKSYSDMVPEVIHEYIEAKKLYDRG